MLSSALFLVLLGQVEIFRLGNGLKVVLYEDHTIPKVAIVTRIAAGSRDEEPGRTGFAHLFEHLMFKGTPAIPDGRMDAVLEEGGGYSTAFTNRDATVYSEWATSSFLETALWIEADRLATLLDAFDDKKLANQRDVVRNERRFSVDNVPYGESGKLLNEALWPEEHGYHWQVIGSHDDLVAASVDDVKRFFRRYYVPANMTMVVAGDFDPAAARALVIKHAGRVPRAAGPVRREHPTPPPITAPIHREATDDVQVPRVHVAWRGPKLFAADEPPTTLAMEVLGGGKASRLYERLVYRERLAQDVTAWYAPGDAGGQIVVTATAKPGVAPEKLEAAILDEVARLAAKGVEVEELAAAKNKREGESLRELESLEGKAIRIAFYDAMAGDPAFLEKDLKRFSAVEAADVQRAAATWLSPQARVVVTISPEKKK